MNSKSLPPRQGPCPCGRARAYSDCCAPLHQGRAAASAEDLMRSRYCAFVLSDHDYLQATWHPSTRPAAQSLQAPEAARTRWLGLKVLRCDAADDTHATVEFVARFRVGGGSAVRQHELSRFERVDGRWLYVDGDTRP